MLSWQSARQALCHNREMDGEGPFGEVRMKHIFDENGKFYRLLDMIMELGVMNFLFLLCSIPLFTLGPAYVALLACADAFWKGEGASASNTFFKHFRAAFLPALLPGLGAALILVLLGYNILFALAAFAGVVRIVLLGVYFLLFLATVACAFYLARIIDRFRNFRVVYLKAALLAVVAHLPQALGIAAVTISPLVLLFLPVGVILTMVPVVLFFWFSTAAAVCIKLSARYMEELEEFCGKC